MQQRSVFISLVTCATLAFTASVAVRADQDGPLAPTKYKDIRVLKDVPVADFDVTMHYFGVSLGWTCQNCHVRDEATGEFNYAAEHRFKTTAREMVEMVKVVNAGDYGAKINCVTCHQGHNEPLGLPVAQMYTPEQVTAMAAQAAAQAARQGGAGARPGGAGPGGQPGAARGQQTPPPPPPFEPIIEKYIAAMGGQATLDKLQTRVTTGTMLNRSSQQVPFTIEEKGNKIRVTMTTAQGSATYAFDGKSGWQQVAGKTEDLDIFRTQQISRLNDLRRASDFSKRYTNLQAGRPTRLPSRTPGGAAINVNLVQGEIASSVVERLFFETTSGLLLRRQVISRAASVNGTLVETIDYSDYKDVAGVQVPFTIRLNNWNTLETYTVTDVKTGAAIEDGKFGKAKD